MSRRLRALRLALVHALLLAVVVAPEATAQRFGSPPVRTSLEVTIDAHSARVLSAREAIVPPERTVLLGGISASYWMSGGHIEFSGRIRKSTLSDDLAFGDLTATRYFGALGADLGAGFRRGYDANTGLMHGRGHKLLRIGGSWRSALTATPLTIEARLGMFVPLGASELPGGALSGWDGESTLRMTVGSLPFDGLVGFRFERFQVDRTVQEVSHLRAGIVWRGGAP
jgi:hypothetical protein